MTKEKKLEIIFVIKLGLLLFFATVAGVFTALHRVIYGDIEREYELTYFDVLKLLWDKSASVGEFVKVMQLDLASWACIVVACILTANIWTSYRKLLFKK